MNRRSQVVLRLVFSLAALALAWLREWSVEGGGGGGWLEPGRLPSQALGLALLGFWAIAAWCAGRRVAQWINPSALRVGQTVWGFLHAYLVMITVVLTLAAFGQINTPGMTVLFAACFVAAGGARAARAESPREDPTSVQAGASGGLGSGTADEAARGASTGAGRLLQVVREHPITTLVLTLVGGITLVNVVWALILPPFAHDDFTYHLVLPVEWMQSGTLSMKAIPFGNHSPAYYPMNTEIFYLTLILPFREAFHVNAAQSLFLAVAILALYEIFRLCKANVFSALMSAALLAVSPVVVAELGKAYVDVAFAAFFLTAVCAALAFGRRPSAGRLVQFAAAVGLVAGTKMPGLVLSALVLVPLLGVVWYRAALRERHGEGDTSFFNAADREGDTSFLWASPRRLAVTLVACLTVFVIGGGWWYLRNLILTGNPVFPLIVELGGVELFSGAYDRSALPPSHVSTLLELFPPHACWIYGAAALATAGLCLGACLRRRADLTRSGDGARREPALPLPEEGTEEQPSSGVPAAVPTSSPTLQTPTAFVPGLALLAGGLLPLVIALIFHFLLPFDYARFVLFSYGLTGALLLAPLECHGIVQRMTELAILLGLGALLCCELFLPDHPPAILLPLLEARLLSTLSVWGTFALGCVTVGAAGLWVVGARGRQAILRWGGAAVVALLVLFFFHSASRIADSGGAAFTEPFRKSREAYIFLDEAYENVKVAAAGTNRSFLLFGKGFKNQVKYVDVCRGAGSFFHDHVRRYRGDRRPLRHDRNGVAYYRSRAGYGDWMRNLEDFQADLLFVERLTPLNLQKGYQRDRQGFPLESRWAEQHPERFRKVFQSPVTRIYEILDRQQGRQFPR